MDYGEVQVAIDTAYEYNEYWEACADKGIEPLAVEEWLKLKPDLGECWS